MRSLFNLSSKPNARCYKGWNRGWERNKAISIAKSMKKDGANINLISKYTGLSVDEIQNIRIDEKKL